MIKRIEFANYKAFDKGSIEFKPITILLGTNSSGKSSLLQLLLLFEQTINTNIGYKSALKLNGKFVNLGEIENIFKNQNANKVLSFSFEISSKKFAFHTHELRRLKRGVESDIVDLYYRFIKMERFFSKSKRVYRRQSNVSHDREFTPGDIAFILKEISRIKRKLKKNRIIEPTLFDDDSNILLKKSIENEPIEFQEALNIEISEYSNTYYFISEIYKLSLKDFSIEYDIVYSTKTKNLTVKRIAIKKGELTVIEYNIQKNKGHIKHLLSSDIIDNSLLEKYRVKFGKNVTFNTLNLIPLNEEPNRFRRNEIRNEMFCTQALKVFSLFTNQFGREFNTDRINYVSPLRAFPKRYYFLDESNVSSSLDSIDGDNLTEILKKESSVISKVNKWLNRFGLSVSVEDVKEVIHRLRVSQNGLNLDITDVGFGISQVLPIIVQSFLSKGETLTIIEQPEIHLHPMMQAELADLFIDVVSSSNEPDNKVLLIETHSESILKRLRRRIAEGKIKNSEVAIYFVHGRRKKLSSAKVERLEITESGAFDWPKEFYSTDFVDTNEFLKLQ